MAEEKDNLTPEESNAPQEQEESTTTPEPEESQTEEPVQAASSESTTEDTDGAEGDGGETPVIGEQEIEEGKAFAILSYVLSLIGLPFFIIPLVMRNNDFALFHAKQCLMIWIVGVVGGTVGAVLSIICIGVVIAIAVGLFCLVVSIMGLIHAVKGEAVALPMIGQYAEDWFKGITKV